VLRLTHYRLSPCYNGHGAGHMGQGLNGVREKLPGCFSGSQKQRGGFNGEGHDNASGSPSYTVEEALSLQTALLTAFKEEAFQKSLRRAEALHPRRGQRGHPDCQKFAAQLHGLLVQVYGSVLPRKPWCLAPGWEGYRQMVSRMARVSEDPLVLQAREMINDVLGLPRHTVLRPPTEEPVLVSTPDGSGTVPKYTMSMLLDNDGDAAHEFWEEDQVGNLKLVAPLSSST